MKKGLAILLLSAVLIGYGAVSGLLEPQAVQASYIANTWMDAIMGIDSLETLASSPEPRTLDATPIPLITDLGDFGSAENVDKTYPIPLDINGAVSADLIFSYVNWTGDLHCELVYGIDGVATTDTVLTTLFYKSNAAGTGGVAAPDSFMINAADLADTTSGGGFVVKVLPKDGQQYLQGYLYLRFWSSVTVDISSLYVTGVRQF